MKKYLALFVLVSALSTLCSAQVQLQANKEGVYRIKPDTLEWIDAGITSHPEALRYDLMFSQAISNPGEKILGEEKSEKILKLKPVFKKLVEVKQCFIVYNNSTKNIGYEELTETKEVTSYLILFGIASIILMIVSNILIKKIAFAAVTFAAIASFFAFVAAIASFFAFVAAIASFFAFVAAAVAATFAATAATFALGIVVESKPNAVCSLLYYILMVTYIILLYV